MKKLFMAIFIPILIIVGTPSLALTLMYDGTGEEHLPVHLYTDEYDAKEMIFEELNNSIEDVENDVTPDLELELSQDIINRAIYEAILDENPNYAPGEDCVTDEECYVFSDSQEAEGFNLSYRLVGAWVSFYDGPTEIDPGRITLNAYLEIVINGDMSYKTVVEVHFLFEDDTQQGQYYLEFDKIQMGRLPLPKSFFSMVIGIFEDQGNIDIAGEIGELPLGEFDLENLSYTLPKDQILTQISDDQENPDSGSIIAQEVLSIIFEENLIQFDLVDTKFVLSAGVSRFKSDTVTNYPDYLYDLHDQEEVDGEMVMGEYNPELFDPETYLQDVFTEYLFNNSIFNTGSFDIEEEVFNKLIYSAAEGFASTRSIQEIPISETETKSIELGLKSIWFEFEEGVGEDPDLIYANAMFKIAGIDSLLVLVAEAEYVDVEVDGNTITELHAVFTEITAGKDVDEEVEEYLNITDLAAFKEAFAAFGDVEFGEFNTDGDLIISPIKLSALMSSGAAADAVKVTSVSLKDDALVLGIEAADPTEQAILENFQSAMNDILSSEDLITDLTTALAPEAGSPEEAVVDAVDSIQDDLAAGEEVSQEQVETLLENLEDLDPESQTEFLDTFATIISDDYGDLLSQFEGGFGALSDEEPTE